MSQPGRVTVFHLPSLTATRRPSTVPARNRKSHGLAIFLGGERTFYFDQETISAGKNTIVYFPKGSNYTIKEKASFDCYAINFQMPDGMLFRPFSFKVKNLNAFLESFKHSQKLWDHKSVGYSAKIKSELYSILYNMQVENQMPYTNPAIIEPALNYIHSHYYKENISVSHLASLCNISTVHLRNIFLQKFSLSPIKYINRLKMTRAEELLSSQIYTVSEVCYLSGFDDESYFCRAFKQYFHITPREYVLTHRS